jgi:hypothetical protein
MTLNERITEALKEAMKNKDEARKRTIRAIKSQILLMQTDGSGQEITPERELKMLQTMVKQREDSAASYDAGGRKDLADTEREEIVILREFLPQQLSESELEEFLKSLIAELGAQGPKDMGKVMGEASKRLLGKADGKLISTRVKALLGKKTEMIIDILLLFAVTYGIYLGYTQGVFRISILALAIIFGLLFSMYLTAPAAEFTASFFGFHYRLLPLIAFIFIVLLLSSVGIFIFKKIEKNLKNTKIAKTEKYLGAVSMAFFSSFLFAVILNFFNASNAINKEIRENSFTYSSLEYFSDSGLEQIKKLAPFVTTFVNSLSG